MRHKTGEPNIPPALKGLTTADIHILTGIPTETIEGIRADRFKPAAYDRELLTTAASATRYWPTGMLPLWLSKKRYQLLQDFISVEEREKLFDAPDPEAYRRELDRLLEVHKTGVENRLKHKHDHHVLLQKRVDEGRSKRG